jgi:UDP-glucuronate 4-epimerase
LGEVAAGKGGSGGLGSARETGATGGPVLVTGAAGFIGSHTCRALLGRGQRVVGVDNFDAFYSRERKRANLDGVTRGLSEGPAGGFTFVELDINDQAGLAALLDGHRPSSVIHLAAKANPRLSVQHAPAYMHANVTATSTLLHELALRRVMRIVIASSSSVYGNLPTAPFSEEMDASTPISPYAASKRACELLGYAHHHLTGAGVAMLRFFTVFGPGQRPDLGISLFLERISTGQTIKLFGDGSMARDCTFVDDVVSGVLAAHDRIDRFGFRVWNLGNSRPITVNEMIAACARVVGKAPILEPAPNQAGDVQLTCADLTRARAELGYDPKTRFEEGVERQWAWAKGMG